MKLAAPPGEPMCAYDWVEFSSEHAHGANTKLCDWSPHVPVYTASNHVMLAFHSDSVIEARGFWIQYVGTSHRRTCNIATFIGVGTGGTDQGLHFFKGQYLLLVPPLFRSFK